METIETITLFASIVLLSVLVASTFCGFLDYADWRSTRRKKRTLMMKDKWAPAYWTRSFVARFAVKIARKVKRYLVNLIYPIIKGMRLGVQSIRTIRAVFYDGEMWFSSARHYLPGTHLTQVWCPACSNQRLGVWLDRLPDYSTGEPLTNKPHKSLCLDCYNKMPKEKRALYSLSWTEYSNPHEDDDEREREMEVGYSAPTDLSGIQRDMSDFWTQRLDSQMPPVMAPPVFDTIGEANGER